MMVSQNLSKTTSAMGLLRICASVSTTFLAGGAVDQQLLHSLSTLDQGPQTRKPTAIALSWQALMDLPVK